MNPLWLKAVAYIGFILAVAVITAFLLEGAVPYLKRWIKRRRAAKSHDLPHPIRYSPDLRPMTMEEARRCYNDWMNQRARRGRDYLANRRRRPHGYD